MAKYKVIALSVGGLGNKVFKLNDEVSENNFPKGHAEELVKKGFLAKAEEPKAPKIEPPKVEDPKSDKKPSSNKGNK